MLYSYSIPHDSANAYKDSIFSGFMASPPPVGNPTVYFLLFSFSSPSVSTIKTSSVILCGVLPSPKCLPGIFHWCITVFFSSTLLSILPLTYVLFFVSDIATSNETGNLSDVLGNFLDICVTIISILKFSIMSPLTGALFLVSIEALIAFSNSHENMVLHSTPSPRVRKTVTGCPFTTKVFL